MEGKKVLLYLSMAILVLLPIVFGATLRTNDNTFGAIFKEKFSEVTSIPEEHLELSSILPLVFIPLITMTAVSYGMINNSPIAKIWKEDKWVSFVLATGAALTALTVGWMAKFTSFVLAAIPAFAVGTIGLMGVAGAWIVLGMFVSALVWGTKKVSTGLTELKKYPIRDQEKLQQRRQKRAERRKAWKEKLRSKVTEKLDKIKKLKKAAQENPSEAAAIAEQVAKEEADVVRLERQEKIEEAEAEEEARLEQEFNELLKIVNKEIEEDSIEKEYQELLKETNKEIDKEQKKIRRTEAFRMKKEALKSLLSAIKQAMAKQAILLTKLRKRKKDQEEIVKLEIIDDNDLVEFEVVTKEDIKREEEALKDLEKTANSIEKEIEKPEPAITDEKEHVSEGKTGKNPRASKGDVRKMANTALKLDESMNAIDNRIRDKKMTEKDGKRQKEVLRQELLNVIKKGIEEGELFIKDESEKIKDQDNWHTRSTRNDIAEVKNYIVRLRNLYEKRKSPIA